MYITAYFTSNGIPATSKTPTINGWKLDGTQVITAQSMSEIAGGFYTFNFTGYDFTQDYVFRAEDTSLPAGEQYVVASNDVDSQRNQGVVKQILGLVQSNFIMTGQTYDGNGNLQSAYVYTYDSASDTNADTNRLHEYSIAATYNGSGQLTGYKVTDI